MPKIILNSSQFQGWQPSTFHILNIILRPFLNLDFTFLKMGKHLGLYVAVGSEFSHFQIYAQFLANFPDKGVLTSPKLKRKVFCGNIISNVTTDILNLDF